MVHYKNLSKNINDEDINFDLAPSVEEADAILARFAKEDALVAA